MNRPAVFVPEADHVTQLVHDDSVRCAVLAQSDFLPTAAPPSDVRTATVPVHNIGQLIRVHHMQYRQQSDLFIILVIPQLQPTCVRE